MAYNLHISSWNHAPRRASFCLFARCSPTFLHGLSKQLTFPTSQWQQESRAHRIEHLARKARSTITQQRIRLKQIPKQSWSCHSAGTHLAYYRQALSKLRQARTACLSLPSPCEVLAISLPSPCEVLAISLRNPCLSPHC